MESQMGKATATDPIATAITTPVERCMESFSAGTAYPLQDSGKAVALGEYYA
jgi:hypothetical protein